MKGKRIIAVFFMLIFLLSGCGPAKKSQEEDAALSQMERLAVELPVHLQDDFYQTTYEIFVYSFCDSNGDGIGDLNGIRDRLDYITQTLGMTEIWTTPIFSSTTYHKYDVVDYMAIDPEFGTMDDFDALLADCHERGVRFILDLAVNHTSTTHPWFRAASDYLQSLSDGEEPSAADCPYFAYYNFSRDVRDGYAALTGTDWYYEARFWDGMPDLNLSNEDVRAEIKGILRFWLGRGVDGFRLDAVTSYYTDNMEASIDFTGWLTSAVQDINPDAYLVGEVWADQQTYARYYESGIPSLFDFQFAGESGLIAQTVRGSRKASAFAEDLAAEEALYRGKNPDAVNAPFYTNHDMARSAGYYAYDDGARTKLALGLNLLMTGNAFVYYGEEIGMKGSGKDENKRAPMLWSSETEAEGQCDGPPGMDTITQKFEGVEEQMEDPESVLRYVQAAVKIRNAFPVIARGQTVMQENLSSDAVCTMLRSSDNADFEPVLIVINTSGTEQKVSLEAVDFTYLSAVLAVSEEEIRLQDNALTLPPFGIAILTQ